jgi:hypothetical protein
MFVSHEGAVGEAEGVGVFFWRQYDFQAVFL